MRSDDTTRLRFHTLRDLDSLPQLKSLSHEYRRAIRVVAHVLPFRVNDYVIRELIDWSDVPSDPIFQLTFPQPAMLAPEHYRRMAQALDQGATPTEVRAVADQIRRELNPHPGGQLTHNVPTLDDGPVAGVQHKYAQTCLVFPSSGQTCHAYCTFCFRWPQFVGMLDLKFATDEAMRFRDYLRRHHEVTDVLFTGGDPMVMRTEVLAHYIEPLLEPEFDHIQTIRIGTKSLTYWPYRYLTDGDADDLLRLCERVTKAGRHLAIMAHFNHWRELEPPVARLAISRLLSVGAVIRTQSPLVRHINDDGAVWVRMWKDQVRLGCVPYYMFIERETGPKDYFRVPLSRALEIYREAIVCGSGLARAQGTHHVGMPGKVVIEGVAKAAGEQVFVLSFLQARDPSWCKRPFFARFDPSACWLDDLRPAFGADSFFYEPSLQSTLATSAGPDGILTSPPPQTMPVAMAM